MKEGNNLWEAVRQRQSEAFRQLYFQLYDRLFRYGLQQLKDREQTCLCINEVFSELWEKAFSLPAVENINGYVFIIFKRKIIHYFKQKNTPLTALPDNELEAVMDKDCSYETMLILMQTREEERRKIDRALQQLTARQKEIIRLRYYLGYSINEIAQKLTLTTRTVYNTLHSAIASLRKELTS